MSDDALSPAALEALGPVRAAAFWLERLQRDDAGTDDELFGRWLAASDANRAAWDRALDLWDVFEEPDAPFEDMRRDALAFRPRAAAPAWLPYAAAASIVAIASTALFLSFGHRTEPGSGPQIASAGQSNLQHFGRSDYTTAVGQRSTVRLADGTNVTLDSNSAIDVAYADGLRMVRLERGQALFNVTHDAAHPFRVAAGGRVVTDLGTRFGIHLSPGETRILLIKGSVGVTKGDDPAHLSSGGSKQLVPGEQLIARTGRPDEITHFETDQAADWESGFLQFDGVPLSTAIAELNRYTKTQLIIRDPAVAAMRISGAFRTGDTARFAETLTALYPLRVVPTGDGNLEIVRRR